MAWMMTVLLLATWALALASGAALGAWVHLLLLLSMVCLAVGVAGSGARRHLR